MFVSPHRKFEAAAVASAGPGQVAVDSALGGSGAVLQDWDLALARLFDGERDAEGVRARARSELGMQIAPGQLEAFAAELAQAGLLRPGRLEPLPPPAQSDAELELLRSGERVGTDLPPSTLPGSRNGPGLLGGLTGLVTGGRRGQANRIDRPVSPDWLVRFGSLLIWPLRARALLLGFMLLLGLALHGALGHRLQWVAYLDQLIGGLRLLPAMLLSGFLVNVFATAARAAAIARYTPEHPRLGWNFGKFHLPQLFVDTAGAAERAGRATRQRVVAAGPLGIAALFALAVLVWFLTDSTVPAVARYAVVVALVSLLMTLVRLNPLARSDGYFLLCQALGHSELRSEAIAALLRRKRPWSTRPPPLSPAQLTAYAVLGLAYNLAVLVLFLVFIGGWIIGRFGGTGFLFLLAVSGVIMQKQYLRSGGTRSGLGWPKKGWMPSRPTLIVLGAILLIGLVPYPDSPSGEFEILPRDRADVRALTAGDVREVLVREGDTVRAGQAIARLDSSAAQAKVAAAEAELARFNAELALTRKGARVEEIEVARKRVATAKTASESADTQARRIERAYKGKSVTPQEYDRARGAADVARQQLIEAQSALDLISSPAEEEKVASLEAEVRRVEAELGYQKRELEYTTITAPIAGRVVSSRLQFARGNYLERGELLATIEDTGEMLAEIKLPQSSIGDVEVGAEASVKSWAFPSSSFDAKVRSIAPAAEDGQYGKVVRVQVAVQDIHQQLKTGMTGNAKVDAGWTLTGLAFTRALWRFLFVEVWSWIP